MPIRWNALEVAEAMDRVEELINLIYDPLEKARAVVEEAREIKGLPQYIDNRLAGLLVEIDRAIGGVDWRGIAYQGRFKMLIQAVRDDIPIKDLAIQQERAKYGVQQSINL